MLGLEPRRCVLLALLPLLLACRGGEHPPTAPLAVPAQESSSRHPPSVRTVGTRPPVPAPVMTPGLYVVRGTVTDAATGRPIEGSDVRLIEFNFGATLRAEQLTNREGQFSFSTGYCDTCFLLAGHPDYYGPAQAFAGTRDRVTIVNFQLSRR